MALISLIEIWRIFVMSLGIGFIFSFYVERKRAPKDIIDQYRSGYMSKFNFNKDNIIFAAAIAAPGVILHELAHKFTAMSFGLSATFYAAYWFLAFAIVLILVGFPMVFFVPGYVSISGAGTYLQYSIIAFAGPLFNLVMFGISWYMLSNIKKFKLSRNAAYAWALSKKINLFLFIFNLLPIQGFDGWSVYNNLFKAFF
jgi:Zn-dependent protease